MLIRRCRIRLCHLPHSLIVRIVARRLVLVWRGGRLGKGLRGRKCGRRRRVIGAILGCRNSWCGRRRQGLSRETGVVHRCISNRWRSSVPGVRWRRCCIVTSSASSIPMTSSTASGIPTSTTPTPLATIVLSVLRRMVMLLRWLLLLPGWRRRRGRKRKALGAHDGADLYSPFKNDRTNAILQAILTGFLKFDLNFFAASERCSVPSAERLRSCDLLTRSGKKSNGFTGCDWPRTEEKEIFEILALFKSDTAWISNI